MNRPTVQLQIGGGAVLAVAGLVAAAGAVWWVKKNSAAIVDAVNPASSNNLVYKGTQALVGEQNLDTAGDYFFGAIDLINPWNESDAYAKQVYGIGK